MRHTLRRAPGTIALLAIALAASVAQGAPIDPASSTEYWMEIPYSSLLPDYADDQQTGQHDSDIVGNATDPALYTAYDPASGASQTDGTLGFRVRLGSSKKGYFEHVLLIGLDADIDGDIDLFLGVDNSGSTAEVGIWSPGNDLNISPATTSIVSTPIQSWTEIASNYDYAPVDASNDPSGSVPYDVDGDLENDYFLSFTVDFQAVVDALVGQGIAFTDSSEFSVVVATSNQINALNNDIGGPDGGIGSSSTWAELGAASEPMSSTAIPVAIPEVQTGALFGLGLVLLGVVRRARPAGSPRGAPGR